MSSVAIILIFLIALLLLVGIIGLVALWLRGSTVIVLPGLGIVMATPLLLALVVAVEVVLLIFGSLLWRLSS